MKDCSQKVFAVDIVSVIVILKSDNLGVGMALGSARFRTVVAEIDYRAEAWISFQQIPFFQAEGNDLPRFFLGIFREIRFMDCRFDNHCGISVSENRILIHEPNDVAFFI